ncbi:MAG: MurR/RpiR family transcriptional regulator [Thermoanaerobaculia bacterium]|nr:MurR/RpiR family transcriptional regulator [Thermoanaerobaculia bacterium]
MSDGPASEKSDRELTGVEEEADFRELVLSQYESLPPQQQVIANHLIDHVREIPFLSIPELARRTGASEATIVRFAQRIGFEGFAELKMVLLEFLRSEMGKSKTTTVDAAVSEDDVLASVSRLEQINLQRTLEGIEPKEFRSAAAALFKADHVYTFGMGVSAYLSDLASYLLTQIGLRSTPFSTKFSSPREQVVALRPTDLVLAFSFPPYSRQTLSLLEESVEKGVPTMVITDRYTSPATRLSKQTFVVPSHNMMFTNAVASVFVLLNALITEIAIRHQGEAVEALSRINRILAQESDLIHERH